MKFYNFRFIYIILLFNICIPNTITISGDIKDKSTGEPIPYANIILSYIDDLNKTHLVKEFFNISAKYLKGIDQLVLYLISQSKTNKWKFINNEILSLEILLFFLRHCFPQKLLLLQNQKIVWM